MPQITPFARAALIEFLVLSLFTGQMSKLPPHGTSPAGPARAPGGQRVPLGRAAAVPPSRTGLAAEPSLTPAPPRLAPLSRPPPPARSRDQAPRGADGGTSALGRGVESSQPPSRLRPPLRIPSRSAAEARASLVPRYLATLAGFGRPVPVQLVRGVKVLSGACPVLSDRRRAEENRSQTHAFLCVCICGVREML